ncbi:MAG: glutamate--cysteine ligase, partial [Pseudomonadota bacterium]
MARDTQDDTPLDDRAQLTAYLADGEKPEADFMIGTEHEKFAYHFGDLSPVPY